MARSPSDLEPFLLAAVHGGVSAPYDLLKHFGLSVGATHPVLLRLLKHGLIRRSDPEEGARPGKLAFTLTAKGERALRAEVKNLLVKKGKEPAPAELESVLRIAVLALITANDRESAAKYLRRAAEDRFGRAKERDKDFKEATASPDPLDVYAWLKAACDRERFRAEGRTLRSLARAVAARRKKSRSSR